MNARAANRNETFRILRNDGMSLADDSTGLYLREIGRAKLLSAEEETELFKQMESGVAGARDRLITANLRFVVSIAKNYVRGGQCLSDLVQEGIFGLIRAVEKFDYRKGYRFATYAAWWIRQAVIRFLSEKRIIRLPAHISARIGKMNRVSRELTQDLGRKPGDEEIAGALGWTVRQFRFVMKAAAQETLSLEESAGEEGEGVKADFVEDKNVEDPAVGAVYAMLRKTLAETLSRLPFREREVIRMRFGLEDGCSRTLKEVGRRLKVSRERARQLELNALRRLRCPKYSRKLKEYMDC
ncbi:MAG: sigma-70 family RNA polymerase sigma factor [Treponema sp.]|jgi:RNA polymerase primary sigma factor|nr:sigma-70 family RNA polymerase sigma factor [Treponema sp.]